MTVKHKVDSPTLTNAAGKSSVHSGNVRRKRSEIISRIYFWSRRKIKNKKTLVKQV